MRPRSCFLKRIRSLSLGITANACRRAKDAQKQSVNILALMIAHFTVNFTYRTEAWDVEGFGRRVQCHCALRQTGRYTRCRNVLRTRI